jgi:hypothetical protein
MTDQRKLIERLAALIDRDNKPDWEDVVRRSEAPAREERSSRPRRSRRSYLARRLVPVFVLAATAFAFVLIAPWQHGPGSTVMERALAAIADRPVLHAVLNSPDARTYIDLATGRERPQFVTTEIWYDRERHLAHTEYTMNGHLLSDVLQTQKGYATDDHSGSATPPEGQWVDPALAGFFDSYRSALKSGDARVTGEGKVDGHDVTWIEFAIPGKRGTPPSTKRVAVDETSSLPVRIEDRRAGEIMRIDEVTSIETLPAGSGDFSKPKLVRGPTYTFVPIQATPIAASAAPEALPGVRWLGEKVSTLSLTHINRQNLVTYQVEPEKSWTSQTGIELLYGDGSPGHAGAGYVWIHETAKEDIHYSMDWFEAPPAGSMVTVCGSSSNCDGNLVKDGVHFMIQASSRELLLEAARALEPIPTSAGAG